MKARWEVYILRTASGHLYTGISTDPERRFQEHAHSRRGGKFFRISLPEAIVFREHQRTRSAATRREAEIKKMSRRDKWKLIQGESS